MTPRELVKWCGDNKVSLDTPIYVWDMGSGGIVRAEVDQAESGSHFIVISPKRDSPIYTESGGKR